MLQKYSGDGFPQVNLLSSYFCEEKFKAKSYLHDSLLKPLMLSNVQAVLISLGFSNKNRNNQLGFLHGRRSWDPSLSRISQESWLLTWPYPSTSMQNADPSTKILQRVILTSNNSNPGHPSLQPISTAQK